MHTHNPNCWTAPTPTSCPPLPQPPASQHIPSLPPSLPRKQPHRKQAQEMRAATLGTPWAPEAWGKGLPGILKGCPHSVHFPNKPQLDGPLLQQLSLFSQPGQKDIAQGLDWRQPGLGTCQPGPLKLLPQLPNTHHCPDARLRQGGQECSLHQNDQGIEGPSGGPRSLGQKPSLAPEKEQWAGGAMSSRAGEGHGPDREAPQSREKGGVGRWAGSSRKAAMNPSGQGPFLGPTVASVSPVPWSWRPTCRAAAPGGSGGRSGSS